MPTAPAATSTVTGRFIEAVVSWDEPTVRTLLDDDVWFRALLVREPIERIGVIGTMEVLYGWYGSAYESVLVHAATEPVTTRERFTYRVRLRPAWEPSVWHIIEQSGYLRLVDGRITRIDLVCTGFHPQV